MDEDEKNTLVIPEISMSVFDRQEVYNNGWTNASLTLMKFWLNDCSIRSVAHHNYADSYHFWNIVVSIPGLIFGGIASALAFWSVGSPDSTTVAISVSVAVLSSISTILKGTEGFFRFYETEQSHLRCSVLYEELARKIEMHIFKPNALRLPVEHILDEISVKYNTTLAQSPFVKIDKVQTRLYV